MANTKKYNQGYQPTTQTTKTRRPVDRMFVLDKLIKYHKLKNIRTTRLYDALGDINSKEKRHLWSQKEHHQYMMNEYIIKLRMEEAEIEARNNPMVFGQIQIARFMPIVKAQEE